jgi:hypothetical protein
VTCAFDAACCPRFVVRCAQNDRSVRNRSTHFWGNIITLDYSNVIDGPIHCAAHWQYYALAKRPEQVQKSSFPGRPPQHMLTGAFAVSFSCAILRFLLAIISMCPELIGAPEERPNGMCAQWHPCVASHECTCRYNYKYIVSYLWQPDSCEHPHGQLHCPSCPCGSHTACSVDASQPSRCTSSQR